MLKEPTRTQAVTQIGMTVAALIAGGYGIFMLSSLFPLPGIKYLLMTPYLSMMIAFVMKTIRTQFVIIKINTVFALIMAMINIYMGLAIFLTGVGAQSVAILSKSFKFTVYLSAAAYSAFTVSSALLVSKLLIGGPVFEVISLQWILTAACIAFAFGLLGSALGQQLAIKVKHALSK